MAVDQPAQQCNTPLRRYIREADEFRTRDIVQKYELPEIGVDGHQNPVFGVCTFEQRRIARVRTKRASFENVVALLAQPIRDLPACAPLGDGHRGQGIPRDTSTAISLPLSSNSAKSVNVPPMSTPMRLVMVWAAEF